MANKCGAVDGGKPDRRFSFSWADEVERAEEEEQQQREREQGRGRDEQPPPQRQEQRQRAKPDPFAAARPREVVLAEKGVDWRARDGDLQASRLGPTCSRTRAQGKQRARAAPAPAPLPMPMQTPQRRHTDAAAIAATPMCQRSANAPPISYCGAWGGKRKCAGGDVSARQVRPAADHGRRRRVFGELNVGECGSSSSCLSPKKSSDSAGTVGIGTLRQVAAAEGANGDNKAPMIAGAKAGGPGVGRKRRGKGRQKKAAKMSTKQQTLLL